MIHAKKTLGIFAIAAFVGAVGIFVWSFGREGRNRVSPTLPSVTIADGHARGVASETEILRDVAQRVPNTLDAPAPIETVAQRNGEPSVPSHSTSQVGVPPLRNSSGTLVEYLAANGRPRTQVGKITADSGRQITRDCPGRGVPNCAFVTALARRVANADDDLDDGWSEWMESEILASLTSAAMKNRFTEVGAKCNQEGCVFFVAGKSAFEMFEPDEPYPVRFGSWLGKQPWSDQLVVTSSAAGDRSVVEWEMAGLENSPQVFWYVVLRRQ